MATIRLTADAAQAKRELDTVEKKLRKVGNEAKKPIRPNVQTGGIAIKPAIGRGISGAGSAVGQIGGALGIGAAGAMGKGLGAIGNIAAGAALGGAVTALAAAAVQLVSSIGDFKSIFEGAKKAIDAAVDPQTVMRQRAANTDTLADAARANGATLAEQFATTEARQNVFGALGATMFNKMGQSIQSAYSGDDKAITALAYLGLTGRDMNGKSQLQQQDMIVRAIADGFARVDAMEDPAARSAAEAELFAAAKNIVGARNMMQARQFAGGWGDYAAQKALFMQEWQDNVGGRSEAELLSAARLAEIDESRAKIQGYTAPSDSASYAVEKGRDTWSAAQDANATFREVRTGKAEYMRPILTDPTFGNALKSIDRNTQLNNELMQTLINRQPTQQTASTSTATYS